MTRERESIGIWSPVSPVAFLLRRKREKRPGAFAPVYSDEAA
jgi:hypothetical protein